MNKNLDFWELKKEICIASLKFKDGKMDKGDVRNSISMKIYTEYKFSIELAEKISNFLCDKAEEFDYFEVGLAHIISNWKKYCKKINKFEKDSKENTINSLKKKVPTEIQ